MPKISLCMIVKPTNDEAKLLDRCLSYLSPYVNEICLNITGKNAKCDKVAKKYSAKTMHSVWENDFAKARNENFKMAKGDWIIWTDCDDVWRGAEKLYETVELMENNGMDIGVINYLYDFDELKRCTVKHVKTRIVKNDGCVKWEGKVHEDFMEQRQLSGTMIEDIEILHLPEKKHEEVSAERNYEIAVQTLKNAPQDARSYWLVANANLALNKKEEAKKYYLEFIERSGSEEEKYLAYLTLADITKDTLNALRALEIRPTYPNAYHKMGELLYEKHELDKALNFLELGLQMPAPEDSIIVFNPLDYTYNPLMMIMRIYFDKGNYEKAMVILEQMIKDYPNDENLLNKKSLIDATLGEMKKVDAYLEEASKLKGNKLKNYLDTLPAIIRSHPKVCYLYNTNFIKQTSSGKDLVFYCSYTAKEWNPEVAETEGVGGSEEAVINLSNQLTKHGWSVTVYNNCGKENKVYNGVSYKHYWEFNARDKQDVVILWRHPLAAEHEINADKIFVDMHDVVPAQEFTPKRLKKIDKIFLKTQAHRSLFPNVPDEKIVIIPNGLDVSMFENQNIKRNPYLILNTSSPDRHLEATLDIFEKLIAKQPEKPWKLAWYYGWGIYDSVHEKNKEMMDYKKRCAERFEKLVKEGRAEGGYMIGHKEIAKKYLEAGIFLYPTQFFEIHCISAAKAQAAGCACITSDFAALNETIKYGFQVHADGKRWGRDNTFGDIENVDEYVSGILGADVNDDQTAPKWAKETFNWETIGNNWHNIISK